MDLVEFLGECLPGKERRLIAPGKGRFSILSLDERDVFEEDRDRSESVGLLFLLLDNRLGAVQILAFLHELYGLIAKPNSKEPKM